MSRQPPRLNNLTLPLPLVMEPSQGDQLAYSDSTYVTDIVVSAGGQSSAPVAVTLTTSNGQTFQTLGILNVNTSVRIEASPDFVPGNQLEFAGDAAGTTAPPAGTVPHADGSFAATADFYVRAYIAADAAWTPWTLITVSSCISTAWVTNASPLLTSAPFEMSPFRRSEPMRI